MDHVPDATPRLPTPRWRRRLLRSGIALAVLLATVAVLGFLVAPRLLREALEKDGSDRLRRRVTVDEVKVNPFTLTIDLNGLVLADRDAPRLLAWEKLHVRLAPWRLLQGYAGVAEIRLTRPFFRVALDARGRLNLQDLIDGDGSPPQPPPPPGQPRPRRLGLALDLLEVVEARVAFADATRAPRFDSELGPLTIVLEDFRTTGDTDSPYSLRGSTEAGESFEWQGMVHSEPLRSSGTIAFKGLKLPKYGPYQVDSTPALLIENGTASMEARYAFELGTERRFFTLSGLRVLVEDLRLARRRDASVTVELPRLEVSGVDLDLLARRAAVAEVKVAGGRLVPRRERDGHLAILDMLETRPGPPSPSPWRWSVARVAVEGLAVDAEDLMAPRPMHLPLTTVSLSLTGLTQDPAVSCPLSASLGWADGGTLSLTGKVRPLEGSGELALDAVGLDLRPISPYADGASPLRLAAGTLGFKARTTFDTSRPATRWTFSGDVRLDGFTFRHGTHQDELVRWRSLELLGVEAASTGPRLSMRTVRLTEPALRAIIFQDGTVSLGAAAPAPDASGAATPAPPAGPAQSSPQGATAPAWRTAIGLFQVVRGSASFVDRSTTPPVLLALTGLEARVTNLSSDPRVRSTVEVSAKMDGAAPVTVSGTLNPLQASAFTELTISAKGLDLTPLDPYAGKHLGYGLQKGKLDVDVTARVEERALQVANVARLDQLTLGEATNSPDATGIPVRLALALLKDRDGVILLDVPVEGKLDDPEFRLGRVIWRTVLNVLVKVATSPFSALAALVGSDKEDISLVEFAPGTDRLDEAGRKRIELLAKSLAQRPGLSLELEPTVDAAADDLALRRDELERRLRRTRAATLRPPPAEAAVDALEIPPPERPRLVETLFAATFPAPASPPKAAPGGAPPTPPTPAEQEARLAAAMTYQPEAISSLLAARHGTTQQALVGAGLDPARIYSVQDGERARKEAGARVYFTIR